MSAGIAIALKVLGMLPWGKIIEWASSKFSKDEKVKTAKMRISNEETPAKDRTDWMEIAYNEIGVTEIPGPKNEKRILDYHASTRLHASKDSVPWCSSFVCWVMEQAGYRSTRSARARSWLKYGRKIDKPVYGCIVVFWRKHVSSESGHVAFYVSDCPTQDNCISVLGGNQSDQVKISSYPKERVLGYFLPE